MLISRNKENEAMRNIRRIKIVTKFIRKDLFFNKKVRSLLTGMKKVANRNHFNYCSFKNSCKI